MSTKEIVDKYLIENWNSIQEQRKHKDFKWFDVAMEIGGSLNIDPEYIRNRFRHLRQNKVTDWQVQCMSELKNIGKKQFEDKLKQGQKSFQKDLEKTMFPKKYSITSPLTKFQYTSGTENKEKGTKEFTFTASEIPTEAQIVEHFNIDLTKYKISQIWHKTTPSGKYSISVNLQALKGNQVIELDEKFIEKLNNVKPIGLSAVGKTLDQIHKSKACLLIPKQDAHWNKFDVNGNNSIEDRFQTFTKTILNQLEKAQATNNIEKIIYVVGSDEFNSEYTNTTTKGTPQQNILTYQEAFEKVSEFSIEFIKLLRFYSPNVEVVLLNGNHDHNVSWHLANLLKHVFSKNDSILIDTELINTKVVKYSSNLILLNHGDEMKPKDLATKFPIIAKNFWSKYENYFVITGDKHHEVAHDYNGVRTYQVPQLSTAKSAWDDKKGHLCSKAESIVFLFEEDGLSNILRKQIK